MEISDRIYLIKLAWALQTGPQLLRVNDPTTRSA